LCYELTNENIPFLIALFAIRLAFILLIPWRDEWRDAWRAQWKFILT